MADRAGAAEQIGWLLDLYAGEEGAILWLLGEDGERRRLYQDFPVTFYAAGPGPRLRALWQFLQGQPLPGPVPVALGRAERCDLSLPEPIPVLAAQVACPADAPRLFAEVAREFPDLAYYDADLSLPVRHAAACGTFPLAYCRVAADSNGKVEAFTVLDSPWEPDPAPAPLRTLSMEPDVDPFHRAPSHLILRSGRCSYRLALEPARPLLVNLAAILGRHDPDVLLTTWGDTWLLPHLLSLSRRWNIPLPLSRDLGRGVVHRRARSYFSYGQVIHRGRQVHLFGRWHIDAHNAMLFHDYGLEGILELARVTALPVQAAARLSPGSGISSLQMITALRRGVLVPWHKQQAEYPKTALDLLHADHGGLVYQPILGLHTGVAELDFVSMYPGIMVRFNLSPETVRPARADSLVENNPAAIPAGGSAALAPDWPGAELGLAAGRVPRLDLAVDLGRPGLIPQALAPLLKKRLTFKARLASLPRWDPRRTVYKARASAHKWLLVTCFGYLGYKNARFGRIEAHEAVTAYGRAALTCAKEAAEEAGFDVLHLYVDSLFVQKPGISRPEELQPLIDEITRRTGLPIALEGLYRWVAFLSSRTEARAPVANRYFGVFQDGSLKLRGLAACRRDTPQFIAETQMEVIQILVRAPSAAELPGQLPAAVRLLRRRLASLRAGQVPLEKLLVRQKLGRALEEYRAPSPAARAAAQLAGLGRTLRPGQSVRFFYTLGGPGVLAWDLPVPPQPASLDRPRYARLLLRAALEVLEPLGVAEWELRDWLALGTPRLHPVQPSLFSPPARGQGALQVSSDARSSLAAEAV